MRVKGGKVREELSEEVTSDQRNLREGKRFCMSQENSRQKE